MNSIPEVILKIVPVIRVTLDCYANNRALFPLQNAIHNLQLSTYWLKEANRSIPKEDEIQTSPGEQVHIPMITSPTLLTTGEHFNYISSELRKIQNEVENYYETTTLPTSTYHKLQRGSDQIMEALFNLEIAINHYEQLRREASNGN
jgi:hypothetical protein